MLADIQIYMEEKRNNSALSVDDVEIPDALKTLLTAVPGGRLTLAIPEDGITNTGASLTVTGTTEDRWAIPSLKASLLLSSVEIAIREEEGEFVTECSLDATLSLPSATPDVLVERKDGCWRTVLKDQDFQIKPLDLLLLGEISIIPDDFPVDLDIFNDHLTVVGEDFAILFDPADEQGTSWDFAITAPSLRWDILAPAFVLDGIMVRASLSPDAEPLVMIVGRFAIGSVEVEIGVSPSSGDLWPIHVQPTPPNRAFPGVMALAAWIAGDAPPAQTPERFEQLDLDPVAFDLAIRKVTLSVDRSAGRIKELQVESALDILGLPLSVGLVLPDLSLTGSLRSDHPVKIRSLFATAGLSADGVPEDLVVTNVGVVAEPSSSSYSLQVFTKGGWEIGPVTLGDLGLQLDCSKTGGISGIFTGNLKLSSRLTLELEAGYAGADTGWRFAGKQADGSRVDIGTLLDTLSSRFGISAVPEPIRSFALSGLSIAFESGSGNFRFDATGGFKVAEKDVTVTLSILLDKSGGADAKGYAATFKAALTVDELVFDVTFDRDPTANLFMAVYRHQSAAAIDLRRLVSGISNTLGTALPPLQVKLNEVKFLYWSDGDVKRFAFGLGMDVVVDLTRLPLVGDRLPPDETLAIDNLQVLYASAAVSAEETGRIAALLPEEVTGLPEDGLSKGVGISADIRFAGTSLALLLPVGDGPASETAKPEEDGEAEEETPSDGTRWFSIQRQFGVFQFNRIGVGFADNVLSLSLDADIALGPLTLSLDGLSAGSALDAFDPVFDLHGLGVDFQKDPLAISGAFIKLRRSELADGVERQFDGAFSLRFKQFGLAGIGSYAQMKSGDASLFLFVQVLAPLGGVPPIFIDGLMAGGGFNRELAIPGIDEVQSFPFLLLGRPPTPGSEAEEITPMDVLHVLEGKKAVGDNVKPRKWVVPRMGSLWLAAGLHFTAFGIIKTRALLIVQPTGDFTIALLGIASMQLPVPAEGVPTYAFLELQLRAVFQPTLGVIEASAVLTSASYLLTRECRLTGGFAFSLWFPPSPHAGDFVVTVGGYHPAFKVPAHYPKVPRVGFNWSVSDCVTVKGEAYFALTPSCIMGGCALEALFSDGGLRAWFIARADFLVSWRPFYFLAEIEISVGVSYRLNLLFCHKTLSVSVGAALTLWGPPTGGKVRVDIVVVSFTVRFGAEYGSGASKPLDWADFSAMLPEPDAICVIAPGAELNRTVDDAASSSKRRWVVQPRGFSFTTQSAIPASRLVCDGPGGTAFRTHAAGAGIDIRPMNLTGVDSTHRVRIARDTVDGPEVDLTGWRFEPRTQPVPKALWGEPPSPFTHIPDRPTADILPDTPTGFQVTTPSPVRSAMAGPAPRHRLMRDYISPPGKAPLRPGTAAATAYRPVRDNITVGQIAAAAGDTAHAARQSILGALDAAAIYRGRCDRLEGLAGRAGSLFTYAPLKQD